MATGRPMRLVALLRIRKRGGGVHHLALNEALDEGLKILEATPHGGRDARTAKTTPNLALQAQ